MSLHEETKSKSKSLYMDLNSIQILAIRWREVLLFTKGHGVWKRLPAWRRNGAIAFPKKFAVQRDQGQKSM